MFLFLWNELLKTYYSVLEKKKKYVHEKGVVYFEPIMTGNVLVKVAGELKKMQQSNHDLNNQNSYKKVVFSPNLRGLVPLNKSN